MVGKGTRIWKVTRLEDGRISGKTAVLKDSWVDKDQPREGDTFHELRDATMPAENHKILMDALLTVENYGDVIIDPGRDAAYPDRTIQLPCSPIPKCATSDSPKWSVGKHKIHHRVVFKEVCTPLRQLRPFRNIFKILGEACIGEIRFPSVHIYQLIFRSPQSASPSWMGSSRYQLRKHPRRQYWPC